MYSVGSLLGYRFRKFDCFVIEASEKTEALTKALNILKNCSPKDYENWEKENKGGSQTEPLF